MRACAQMKKPKGEGSWFCIHRFVVEESFNNLNSHPLFVRNLIDVVPVPDEVPGERWFRASLS